MKSTNFHVKYLYHVYKKKKRFKVIIKMYILLCDNFVAHELLFNHSHLAVLSAVLTIVSKAFLFLVPDKPMSDWAWQLNPLSQPLLAYNLHTIHYFCISLRVTHICTSSHGTVNSHIYLFILFENINISGRNDV